MLCVQRHPGYLTHTLKSVGVTPQELATMCLNKVSHFTETHLRCDQLKYKRIPTDGRPLPRRRAEEQCSGWRTKLRQSHFELFPAQPPSQHKDAYLVRRLWQAALHEHSSWQLPFSGHPLMLMPLQTFHFNQAVGHNFAVWRLTKALLNFVLCHWSSIWMEISIS